jgi:1-phosphofructokinase
LLEKKLEKVKDGDFFVLSGSLSSALGDNFYSEIIEKISHKKVEIIVDTRGNALKATLKNNPFLIKPNHLELGELFGATVDSKEKAAFYGRKLLETGVKNIIISMGSKGAVFLNKNLQLFASPVEGNVISTIGAGDSVVAGFIHRYVETKNEKDSFRFGVSCGTVTAFSSDLCKKSDVNNMLNKIEIIDF